jgi:hypothetical protein
MVLLLSVLLPTGIPIIHTASPTGLSVSLLIPPQAVSKARLRLWMEKDGGLYDSLGKDVSDKELEAILRGEETPPCRTCPVVLVISFSRTEPPSFPCICAKINLLKEIAVRQRPVHVYFQLSKE